MIAPSQQPLTQAQREILRLFAHDLPESEWDELRRVIARHFSAKAKAKMDQVWDEKEWTENDMDRMLHEHRRTTTLDSDAA